MSTNRPTDCHMCLNWMDDYNYDCHEIEFDIWFSDRQSNKIKLLYGKIDEMDNPKILHISPDSVKKHFFETIAPFRNSSDSYSLPYSIMLKIMLKYDPEMYKLYATFHEPEHDDIIIHEAIDKLNTQINHLRSLLSNHHD